MVPINSLSLLYKVNPFTWRLYNFNDYIFINIRMQICVQSVSQKGEGGTDLGQIQHTPFKYRLPLHANSIFLFSFQKKNPPKFNILKWIKVKPLTKHSWRTNK